MITNEHYDCDSCHRLQNKILLLALVCAALMIVAFFYAVGYYSQKRTAAFERERRQFWYEAYERNQLEIIQRLKE